MTNGEMIETILNVDRDCTEVYGENGTMTFTVTQDWWNAEYKEPTTKNDLAVECISRKEVEKLVYRFLQKGTDENIAFYEHFLDLPSVTPIRPKGHWIDTNNLDVKYKAIYMCSNCRSCYTEMKPINMNFCPNCGADMREVEE